MGHLAGGHGLDLGIGGLYHLEHTLPKSLGWPLFLTSVVGGGWAKLRHSKRAAVLFLFPALFYVSTASGRTVFLRYMLPMLPFLCVAAGWFLAAMRERLRPPRVVWWLALLLLLARPAVDAIATDRVLSRQDARDEAARWLMEEAGPGTVTVHQTGSHWGWLDLPPDPDSLRARLDIARRARPVEGLEAVRAWSLRKARVKLEAAGSPGFSPVAWDSVGGFDGAPPEWVVELRSPLVQYSRVPEALEAVLAQNYALVHRVHTGGGGWAGWYDQHDAFYLPFRGIGSVDRPGPEVRIHRRTSLPNPDSSAVQEAR